MGRVVVAFLSLLHLGTTLTSLFGKIALIPEIKDQISSSGPPKLLVQPPEEVWFQPGAEEVASKFSLKCIASDNAET